MAAWPWYLTDLRLALCLFALSLALPDGWASPLLPRVLGAVAAAGCGALVCFYLHAVPLVFNRRTPSLLRPSGWPPLWQFFRMTRPLELILRLATAPLRDVPDVVILGEVRCGTTTLADHVKRFPGAAAPFCPWIHPLEDKESFFFAGHYFGIAHPTLYRSVFPLRCWRWLARARGRPYFTFDAHAQALTAPWCAARLRAATAAVVSPSSSLSSSPPELVACVREPVAQAVSWWRFEQAAMQWANQGLGLREAQTSRPRYVLSTTTTTTAAAAAAVAMESKEVPSTNGPMAQEKKALLPLPSYPPGSLADAFRGSNGEAVSALYQEAEQVMAPSAGGRFRFFLPTRFGTWPHGQLFAAARCGRYADNLRRYCEAFNDHRHDANQVPVPGPSLPECITVVELEEELSGALDETLKRVGAAIERAIARRTQEPDDSRSGSGSGSGSKKTRIGPAGLERIQAWRAAIRAEEAASGGRRHAANRSSPLENSAMEPDDACKRSMAAFFREHNERFFELIGRRFDHWHRQPFYDDAKGEGRKKNG